MSWFHHLVNITNTTLHGYTGPKDMSPDEPMMTEDPYPSRLDSIVEDVATLDLYDAPFELLKSRTPDRATSWAYDSSAPNKGFHSSRRKWTRSRRIASGNDAVVRAGRAPASHLP